MAKPTAADPFFYHIGRGENCVIIAVYVDDLLAARNSVSIEKVANKLKGRFEINELGEVKCCLGIEFKRKGDTIVINQKVYMRDLLKRFDIENYNNRIIQRIRGNPIYPIGS